MVSRDLRSQLSSPKDTSIPYYSELSSSSLLRQEEEWMVLQDRDLRSQYPHIVNNTLSDSLSIGVMNDSREMYCGNWTATGKWDEMESRTVSSMLLCSLLLSVVT